MILRRTVFLDVFYIIFFNLRLKMMQKQLTSSKLLQTLLQVAVLLCEIPILTILCKNYNYFIN